jgi:hypothetical protein
LKIDKRAPSLIPAIDQGSSDPLAKFGAVFFGSLADIFERCRHVGNRALVKFGQHYHFRYRSLDSIVFSNQLALLPCLWKQPVALVNFWMKADEPGL